MIKRSYYFYIDGIFITTKDFYQMIIIMYYNEVIKKKFPGYYILVNTKEESNYKLILKKYLKNIYSKIMMIIN